MKKLIFLLIFMLPLLVMAQVDTVCYQSTSSVYQVPNVPGNTYTWNVVSPGVIVNGQGTNVITVNWGSANPGLITNAVSVFPTNQFGCVGPIVDVDVFVLNVIPTIAPIGLCLDAGCVPLVGSPIGGTWSGNGVVGNQFCPSVAGVGTSTITYTYSLGGCVFTATTGAVVNPLPTISPIQFN
jgi:hypothetical protein